MNNIRSYIAGQSLSKSSTMAGHSGGTKMKNRKMIVGLQPVVGLAIGENVGMSQQLCLADKI